MRTDNDLKGVIDEREGDGNRGMSIEIRYTVMLTEYEIKCCVVVCALPIFFDKS